MNPVLFRIGALPISSFGLLLLLAFWLGISMTRRRTPAIGIDRNTMLDLALYMIIAGIIAGRLGYVLVNISNFATAPMAAVTIWRDGGLTFYGALAGGALIAWLFARGRGVAPAALLDAATPGLTLGYAVGMIGALLHSTAQNPLIMGKPTGVPWAVQIGFERVHPTQIYLAVAGVAIFYVLRGQRDAPRGVPFFSFLFLQGVSRFVVEFFVQSRLVFGPLTLAQMTSGAVALVALVALAALARRPQETPPVAPGWSGDQPASPPPVT